MQVDSFWYVCLFVCFTPDEEGAVQGEAAQLAEDSRRMEEKKERKRSRSAYSIDY